MPLLVGLFLESAGKSRSGLGPKHLLWVSGAAAAGFLSSYVFASLLRLPPAIYLLVYFIVVGGLITLYVRRTGLLVLATGRRRLIPDLL
jgi:hypothetical protein